MRYTKGGDNHSDEYDSYVEYLFSICSCFIGAGYTKRRVKTDPRRRVLIYGGLFGRRCDGCGERMKRLKQYTYADQREDVAFCSLDCWGHYQDITRKGRRYSDDIG